MSSLGVKGQLSGVGISGNGRRIKTDKIGIARAGAASAVVGVMVCVMVCASPQLLAKR